MKRLTVMLAMLAVLALSSMASAALIVHADPVQITYLGIDYTQFTVWVEGTDGDVLGGFDGNFDGPMHQVWLFGGFLATPLPVAIGDPAAGFMTAEQVAADTHMLYVPAVAVGIISEDGIGGPPLPEPPGLGSWLGAKDGSGNRIVAGMAFGIEVPDRSAHFNLAQIVIPNAGQVVVVGALVADASGAKFPVNLDLVSVPEPATMALLGLGGVLVLIRRRRA